MLIQSKITAIKDKLKALESERLLPISISSSSFSSSSSEDHTKLHQGKESKTKTNIPTRSRQQNTQHESRYHPYHKKPNPIVEQKKIIFNQTTKQPTNDIHVDKARRTML
jgi:type II secretory ATPase GspE/PulE/Tfp pilus assembly ATPase PilB-like protein